MDLQGADLQWADLRESKLETADLREAKLEQAAADENTAWPDGFAWPFRDVSTA